MGTRKALNEGRPGRFSVIFLLRFWTDLWFDRLAWPKCDQKNYQQAKYLGQISYQTHKHITADCWTWPRKVLGNHYFGMWCETACEIWSWRPRLGFIWSSGSVMFYF